MTTFHRDDLTGEEHRSGRRLMSFGITQEDTLIHEFETHADVYHEEPERIAERLHDEVDEWLEETREYLAEEVDDE